MAIKLLNNYVAVKAPEETQGVMKGEVVMVAEGITDVAAGNKVYFPKYTWAAVRMGGVEILLIDAREIIAKL